MLRENTFAAECLGGEISLHLLPRHLHTQNCVLSAVDGWCAACWGMGMEHLDATSLMCAHAVMTMCACAFNYTVIPWVIYHCNVDIPSLPSFPSLLSLALLFLLSPLIFFLFESVTDNTAVDPPSLFWRSHRCTCCVQQPD